MKIDVLTLFPEMFEGPFNHSIVKIAKEKGLVDIKIHNLRDWATDSHKTVDDKPYGGGKGMVIRVDIVDKALRDIKGKSKSDIKTILLSPQGKVFNQKKAKKYSSIKQLILISGHYEGFDERVKKYLVDEEVSIGDYVLTGGEIPSMVIIDSVIRLIPGVLEKEAIENESFNTTLLDYPQYTRPKNYKGWEVPEILTSGNHAQIDMWRNKKAKEKTKKVRPDLNKS
jgi:tRNA (guanine37-N1)-methyltransferase